VLTHPILDQLGQLGLSGMAQAFAELEASDETATLTHADWLGLLVDRELTHRRDKRLAARLRYARLRLPRFRGRLLAWGIMAPLASSPHKQSARDSRGRSAVGQGYTSPR